MAVFAKWPKKSGSNIKQGDHNQKIIGSAPSGITWTVFNLGCVFASMTRNILF